MAKQRVINTRFWHDTFIREKLNPLDRYLFLYFLTNDKTNICGIYELPISIIASETGIEIEMIRKMLHRLADKIFYLDGWIYIKNFSKYQNTSSDKIKRGIERALKEIPDYIKEKINKIDKLGYSMDTLSIPLDTLSTSEPEPEPEPELKKKTLCPATQDIVDIITFLNLKTGASYKTTTKKTKNLIKARFKEGFTLDNFKYVIERKVHQWREDAKMSVYLRPETLFGSKFDSYLNEPLHPWEEGYKEKEIIK